MKRHLSVFALVLVCAFPAYAKTVLVTGSNRGIGLEFVTQYAAAGWDVIATSRTPDDDDALKAMAAANPKIVMETLDVTNLDHISALAAKYDGTAIDILINNAGTLGSWNRDRWGPWDLDHFQSLMAINVFGPLKITEAFEDHVAISDEKKIIAISSYNGSIDSADRSEGARSWYGISKTALNMAMRGVAMRLKERNVIVGIIHPGGVNTRMIRQSYGRMSPAEAEAATDFVFPGFTPMTPDESVSKMRATFDSLDMSQSGEFLNYNGRSLPW